MNWQNADSLFEKEQPRTQSRNNDHTNKSRIEEEKRRVQLKKYEDPSKNTERQAYILLVTQFGDLLLNNKIDQIIKDLLTEDCELFLFSTYKSNSVKYALKPQDIQNLYKGMQIQNRIVRKTYVDLEKNTAIQVCNMKILYAGEKDPSDEIVCEIFTTKNDKIRKYRAFFGHMTPAHGTSDPFAVTVKDRILAKVKEMNYALANQPDLEKVASLFQENTQYKIWSFDSKKCFTFGKHDFAAGFRNLEEDFMIKCIVPYRIYTESEVAVGTYAYHLEKRSGDSANLKFTWISTCFFSFDQELNLAKINQQGELHPAGEVDIEFDVVSEEMLLQRANRILKWEDLSVDLYYNDIIDFRCFYYQFSREDLPNSGLFQGADKVENMLIEGRKGHDIVDFDRIEEKFLDYNDPSYDVMVMIHNYQSILDYPSGYEYNGKRTNTLGTSLLSFENGKLVNIFLFLSVVPEPIPSPFDDPASECANLKSKNNFI